MTGSKWAATFTPSLIQSDLRRKLKNLFHAAPSSQGRREVTTATKPSRAQDWNAFNASPVAPSAVNINHSNDKNLLTSDLNKLSKPCLVPVLLCRKPAQARGLYLLRKMSQWQAGAALPTKTPKQIQLT